jgi:hypothetical protein
MIVEAKLDQVSFANSNETAGHFAAEGPEQVIHTVGQPPYHFLHLQRDDDFRSVAAGYGWRHIGRLGEDGNLFADERGVLPRNRFAGFCTVQFSTGNETRGCDDSADQHDGELKRSFQIVLFHGRLAIITC